MRALRGYLIEFKRKPHRCSCCQEWLNRVSLMLDGVAINKDDINNQSQRLDDEAWSVLQTTRLTVLCRFCSQLYTPPLPVFFDLVDFQHVLLFDSTMNASAVREYITRLRRIDALLKTLNVEMPQLNVAQITAILAEHYSGMSLKNAVSALNKYETYLFERHAQGREVAWPQNTPL